jgi:hypothetical protein
MSAVAGAPAAAELYGRYKTLALAVGAALVLDTPRDELAAEVAALVGDATAAAAAAGGRDLRAAACVDAARDLLALVEAGGADVAAARASHKRLRREMWKVIPCEYVPCCASGHGHD